MTILSPRHHTFHSMGQLHRLSLRIRIMLKSRGYGRRVVHNLRYRGSRYTKDLWMIMSRYGSGFWKQTRTTRPAVVYSNIYGTFCFFKKPSLVRMKRCVTAKHMENVISDFSEENFMNILRPTYSSLVSAEFPIPPIKQSHF